MTDTRIDHRPDPDALLAEVQQADCRGSREAQGLFRRGSGRRQDVCDARREAQALPRGRMLWSAMRSRMRTDTEALLLGMELLPYQFVEYKNVRLKEFDLDAALKRKPAILLVDELAHTNAPGMRHPKRWQDVMEVLDAGIDVYTTLNVQHLESVNDIVERITSREGARRCRIRYLKRRMKLSWWTSRPKS